jgi:hypothetical protein
MEDKEILTPSEAVYGFAAWLSTRETPVTLGAQHECPDIPRLVGLFCDANNLPRLRESWHQILVHPEEPKKPESCPN